MATIRVRGQGSVPTPADEALLSIEVASVAESAAEAFAETTRKAAALSSVLDEAGVDAAVRSTMGISVHEVDEFDGQRPVRRRHRAATTVTLRLSDPEAIAGILRTVVERSDASIRGPIWRAVDIGDAESAACRAAVDDANHRAAAYAGRLGLEVGAVVAVDDEPSPVALQPRAVAAATLPIYPEELSVFAAVSITFELVSP